LREAQIDLRTATRTSLAGRDLFVVSQELFDQLEVGDRSGANRGVLLLIAASEEKVRMVVSYDLEELYPDLFVGYVEREQMVPYFRDGLVGEGIEATLELIAGRAFDRALGSLGQEVIVGSAPAGSYRQGGAGAEVAAPLGDETGSDRTPLPADERLRYGPQPTAELAWSRFLEIQHHRVKDARLGLYDRASQELLSRRPNTDAGQDHLSRLYTGQPYEIRIAGDLAAVVFPGDDDHLLAPWFFQRSAAGWRLDGGMYPEVIGYNHRNQWHFNTTSHPYAFAFRDYLIDRHGFARKRE
jgi:hypothetical protein